MTAYLLGAATLILLVLIFWRRASPEFRRKSEQPKYQFLANLGFRPDVNSRDEASSQPVNPEPKGPHEEHKS